jgi:hypothetical protein
MEFSRALTRIFTTQRTFSLARAEQELPTTGEMDTKMESLSMRILWK